MTNPKSGTGSGGRNHDWKVQKLGKIWLRTSDQNSQ
jgi:hypothetical protein